MVIKSNGCTYLFTFLPLHRRRQKDSKAYSRPTDWIAQSGARIAWGRTRREAQAALIAILANP